MARPPLSAISSSWRAAKTSATYQHGSPRCGAGVPAPRQPAPHWHSNRPSPPCKLLSIHAHVNRTLVQRAPAPVCTTGRPRERAGEIEPIIVVWLEDAPIQVTCRGGGFLPGCPASSFRSAAGEFAWARALVEAEAPHRGTWSRLVLVPGGRSGLRRPCAHSGSRRACAS
jgi:hypothetical protein